MTDQVTKNLSRSFADHFCEFTEFKVKIQKALDELSRQFERSEIQISENYRTFEKATIALNINLSEIEKRLFSLEEKERQRDRDEFQREQALDFKNSEGLGEY